MKVPLVDLAAQHSAIEHELLEVFQRVVQNSTFILGPEVKRFEERFASYLGASQAVAVNSGTSALHLVLQASGIGPGDEVITAANTFIATAEAISAVGARPVFVDVDPISYTIDASKLERAITKRTRAIIPVHLYGQAADLDPILALAHRLNLIVIEDACQAHGAEYKGRKVGTFGVASCFSFYPSKNLGCCGEGGAVVTNDSDLANRVRMLSDHGTLRKYEHRFPGYNLRMSGLQGGILAIKLKYLGRWNQQRRNVAGAYTLRLAGTGVALPTEMHYAHHVYHLYVVQTAERDALHNYLAQQGIETGLHYPVPLHLQEAYRHLGYQPGDFPRAESLARRCLSLPLYPEMGERAVDCVTSSISQFWATQRTSVSEVDTNKRHRELV